MPLERVLMVVKTYPNPSRKYGELTCTAGIRLRDNSWVRIYPYPFRLLDYDYRFRKYDVLELPLVKAPQDPRPDSYRLEDHTKIRVLGNIPSGKRWEERMRYIRPTVMGSTEEFEAQMVRRERLAGASLQGLFGDEAQQGGKRVVWGRTIAVIAVQQASARLEAEYLGEDWPPEAKAKLEAPAFWEEGLFEGAEMSPLMTRPKELLRFCPYRFHLTFTDLAGRTVRKVVTDWEIYSLYFKEERRLESREKALESVRYKVEREIFAPDRETFLVVGSIHHRYARKDMYAVIGFIWPKCGLQTPLFSNP
jgi:hypothetical protein